MSLSAAAVSQFKSLIWYSLDHDLKENAIFFAERLHAYATLDEETQYLLAKCLFREKKYLSAYQVLRSSPSFSCKFLLARCCLHLNKLEEAEKLLLSLLNDEKIKYEELNLDKIDHQSRFYFPDKSMVHFNLGLVYRQIERQTEAIQHFSKCLELNPYHWTAFENICNIKNGTDIDVNSIFDLNRGFQVANCYHSQMEKLDSQTVETPLERANEPKPAVIEGHARSRAPIAKGATKKPALNSSIMTRSRSKIPTYTGSTESKSSSTEPSIRKSTLPKPVSIHSKDEPNSNVVRKSSSTATNRISSNSSKTVPSVSTRATRSTTTAAQAALPTKRLARVTSSVSNPSAPVMKSRLPSKLSKVTNSTTTNGSKGTNPILPAPRTKRTRLETEKQLGKTEMDKKVRVEVVVSNSTHSDRRLQSADQKSIAKRKGAEIVLNLLRKIGQSLVYLRSYKCEKALESYSLLPTSQFNTGWILSCVGKAYFELAKYKEAEEKFEQMRLVEPYRLDGLETYSATLWHLQKEVDLSHLGHELMDVDRDSPQTWFAVGNCYSLRQEHQSAIRCFKRAIQLDPNMAYGHTLCGHEYISIEEYDDAMTHFRHALRLDPNHYNAWYGMGTIALKTDKIPTAKYYFSKAVGINPTNNVLLCCVGTVLEKSGKPSEALRWYQAAEKHNPSSPLPKLKIAKILMALGKFEEALPLFQHLKETYPQEASIRFLIGQTLKKLGNSSDALMEFTKALDMDCKNTNAIRDAIDNIPATENDFEASSHEEETLKNF
ncbi:anaphase-promoting complex subunit cdc27 [Basidiobolus ranarum]|uniref:Anaphase-promoting complex subunit cdc27 n=1 Tax=Basidiobolus ranarum TaxID=34480 RepID=A0ABR2VVY3_9FUNG